MHPIIVFDLDGTIVDTARDLIDSINHGLTLHGREPVVFEEMRRYAGHGGKAMFERVHAMRRITLQPDTLSLLVDTFLRHYEDNIPGSSALYHGADATFARFEAAGYRLAVCTNKPQRLADRLLAAMGYAQHFAAICGADAFPFRKPDPRHLLETIARAGGDPERAVMVGDSRTDIDTAKAAGVPVVAVDFGYSEVPVAALEPSAVISGLDEFTVEMVERLIRAARG